MLVTLAEFQRRADELVERAAAGEVMEIIKDGIIKAKMVPPPSFDVPRPNAGFENFTHPRKASPRKRKR